MLYKINRDVPANTAVASPDWQKLKVCKGTIKEWIVYCPEECADLMKFKVEYQGHQILPITRGEWMDAFAEPTKPTEDLKLDVAPYVLDVYAYNLDDLYSHEYNLYVDILREKPFVPPKSSFNIRTAWSNILGGKS